MAGYKIQLKDKNGNRQYPVSTVDVVVDADGVSVADLLDRKQPTLVSGVNIKTINGKTLLGEGDLVLEGGNGGGSDDGSLGYGVITLYAPAIDEVDEKVLTYDECLAEIENNFGEGVEIPQLIKDAVSAFVISMKEHNASEYARARQMTENGEKVMVLLKGYEYPMLLLALYLLNISLGNEPPVTPEEFVSEFNASTQLEEMIFPEGYIVGNIEGEFGIEVSYDRYKLNPDENGEWTIISTESVRKYAILYYEGTARLTAQQCETNLKSKGNRLNNCDFQVNRCRGDGWSDNEDVLIIGKTTKTVSDFVDLDGTISTRDVVAFRYLDDLNMVELQVSTYDGYCRKVVLGQLQLA